MEEPVLSVREMQERDIAAIAHYWLSSEPDFLRGMGVDLAKLPAPGQWQEMLATQLSQSYEQKQSYCLIWEVEGQAVGHSNVNKIVFGQEAYMHLHLWTPEVRRKGIGVALVKKSLPYFFKNLRLKTLFCEPYALNPAPNKTLRKAGFDFVKEYRTTPGWINFEQPVSLWQITAQQAQTLPESPEQEA